MNYISIIVMTFLSQSVFAEEPSTELRGDPVAISDAEAMVATMGGIEIWKQIESLHFVHEWYPINRVDT